MLSLPVNLKICSKTSSLVDFYLAITLAMAVAKAGYDVEFTEKPDPLLHTECSICQLVLRSPCETTCCGVYFCKPCIEKHQKHNKTCPSCRGKLCWQYSPAHEQWVGELGPLREHLIEEHYPKELVYLGVQCSKSSLLITQEEEIVYTTQNAEIKIFIPKGMIKDNEKAKLLVKEAIDGPFEFPHGCKAVSPVYLVEPSKGVKLQKGVTVHIRHTATVQSEEDCKALTFMSAASTPQNTKHGPSYRFKRIIKAKGVFEPGSQYGKITLDHYCLICIVKVTPECDIIPQALQNRRAQLRNEQSKNIYMYCAKLTITIPHVVDFQVI